MVSSIKRVAGTPRDSVVNIKLSPLNDCTGAAMLRCHKI